ncbi:hypothetical protein M0655_23445 (plasmid) [Gordonia amicalis]|uniref:hypothetical protein n=1 Tax=Gordonia amicalis TaxID=89053 RepID=UPI0015F59C32|nr:hypothetical protein [Gordonia amicalis]MBA5846324.1 hypothetical protein [Gordonia amicalis]MDH3026214.1 hypothetical protein [Gordonia alkanivorans]UOG23668.1 hypothetical protein MTX80_22870 [Gordonia amicalis]UPW16458.1 hypothetical protein M0655_23445 [Gordonia amicalis]
MAAKKRERQRFDAALPASGNDVDGYNVDDMDKQERTGRSHECVPDRHANLLSMLALSQGQRQTLLEVKQAGLRLSNP